MENRRYYGRIEKASQIAIKLRTNSKSWLGAPTYLHDTLDVSRNGLSFRTYERIPAESSLMIEVMLIDPPRRLNLAGVVRWSSMIGDDDLYSVGVELVDLVDDDGRSWLTYIDSLVNS